MHPTHFDALAKSLGRLPRRRLLGSLASGTLGTLLGVGAREAAARSCHHNDDCPKHQVCKNRVCIAKCGDPGVCGQAFPRCGKSDTCFCAGTATGKALCVQGGSNCAELQICTGHKDCPRGLVCGTGCCAAGQEFTCQPPCGGHL